MKTGKNEQPLFTISPSSGLHLILFGLIFLVVLPIFVFGVTMPVLTTGSLHAIWPADGSSYGKLGLFFNSIIFYLGLPLTLPLFKVGRYYFYEDRLEVKNYLLFKRYVFQYNEIYTMVIPNQIIVISKIPIPEWLENPIKRFKSEYINGFYITLNSNYYEDKDMPELNSAIEVLKKKSAAFIQK
jgi:hypothetical protein